MGTEEESGCGKIKRKKPLDLDWDQLLPRSCDDDRPPELVVKSKKKSKGGGGGGGAQENRMDDVEIQTKSFNEITESITRIKKNLQTLAKSLPDNGEKLRRTLQRYEDELERRNKVQSEKGDLRCDETIQLSDHSDEGASNRKKKNEHKSSSTSTFAKMLSKRMEEDSRTVNAFERELPTMNHCQVRKGKLSSQLSGKGKSKKKLPSPKTPITDSKKQITSSPERFPPTRNLRPRHKRTYHLVDEEPQYHSKIPYAELDDCAKDVKVYYPSRNDPDSVEVNYADMACLKPEACLSSTIMSFYIRYLEQPSSSSENETCHYHFFNTYFYNKIEKCYEGDSFLKFRKWWKGVNIFEKAYILLPIHENAHWSLVIICLPTNEDELGPILLHLDSLGLHNSKSLFENIKRFLKEEWSYLRKSEPTLNVPIPEEIWENLDTKMDQKRVTVPQQMNEYDCGLFVLLYMERFIKEAPKRLKKKHLSMFGKQWFQPEEASDLRVRVHNLLVQEFKKAKEEEKI